MTIDGGTVGSESRDQYPPSNWIMSSTHMSWKRDADTCLRLFPMSSTQQNRNYPRKIDYLDVKRDKVTCSLSDNVTIAPLKRVRGIVYTWIAPVTSDRHLR